MAAVRHAAHPAELPLEHVAEALVSLVAPTSLAADQYRALRHSVENLRRESSLQVAAITSPSPGDGKTITTLNLAGALAQAPDARILVVEADLRRPSMANYLGSGARLSPGLVDVLRDSRLNWTDVVRRVRGRNLWIAPAGAPESAPYELLSSPRLQAFLDEARREYDFVIVDTPPAVPLPDCRLLERCVDGFLIVVAAHKTQRALLGEALDQLDPSKVVGIVFNADDRPTASYYGYYAADHDPHGRAGRWWRRLIGRP